jgi:hypothetical protein
VRCITVSRKVIPGNKPVTRDNSNNNNNNNNNNNYATSRKVTGSNPDKIDFFKSLNPSSLTMTLGSTQLLTEMNTRNILERKGRPARKAEPPSMKQLSRKCGSLNIFTTLWASTTCYRDSFTFFNNNNNDKLLEKLTIA